MKLFAQFLRSSIGKKWIVALTGFVLVAYVIGHLVGNLQIFMGPEQLNLYAKVLHDMGPMLWVVRIFLLLVFVLHIVTTILLARQNRAARPDRYLLHQPVRSTFASRTMIMSGLIVLCFVIYHILHFTVRVAPAEFADFQDPLGRHDTYRMVVTGFQSLPASFFYIVGVGLLCLHLSHGFQSMVQTLGLNSRRTLDNLVIGSRVLAALIFIGYVSIPISVYLGILRLP